MKQASALNAVSLREPCYVHLQNPVHVIYPSTYKYCIDLWPPVDLYVGARLILRNRKAILNRMDDTLPTLIGSRKRLRYDTQAPDFKSLASPSISHLVAKNKAIRWNTCIYIYAYNETECFC